MEQAKQAPVARELLRDIAAAWDFSTDIKGTCATDISPNRLDGEIVNLPVRGMTGWN